MLPSSFSSMVVFFIPSSRCFFVAASKHSTACLECKLASVGALKQPNHNQAFKLWKCFYIIDQIPDLLDIKEHENSPRIISTSASFISSLLLPTFLFFKKPGISTSPPVGSACPHLDLHALNFQPSQGQTSAARCTFLEAKVILPPQTQWPLVRKDFEMSKTRGKAVARDQSFGIYLSQILEC